MSEHTIDSVYAWALENMEGADGLEFGLFSCIADAIEMYRNGKDVGACDECVKCYYRRQNLLALSDELYGFAGRIREEYGVRPRGKGGRK